jgi:hypothetical protein
VTGDGVCGLASGEVDCHGDDLLGLDGEVDGIRDGESAIGDADGGLAGEGDFLDRLGLNLVDAERVGRGQGDSNGGDGQVGATKNIRKLETDLRGGRRHVQRLADGRVGKDNARLVLES